MLWAIDHSSPMGLRDQIATCVRRALASGDLTVGAQLPPAAELAEALSVDRNTVLAAYRQLRDGGVLEFRRGRGVRVATAAPSAPAVVVAATELIDLARTHGMGRDDLIRLIQELT
ncbi:GntR family transcriptional regulator [Miltoncostaea oceani]|jgi:GntR family transcriptional regulator|uniref:GntR family transcriptional regulator n=1 Tax=Miltoncostaea oceani TaxID=2843216 RepID=UPI001C3DD933|nr:GntR family transcriptional regulator [Miltoncostaea oceani]